MLTVADTLPEDWRAWPEPAKRRLRWRLQARPNQLTPERHYLCRQTSDQCDAAVRDADERLLEGEERLAFLQDHGHMDWLIWTLMAGRGYGKTRSGAEDAAKYGRENPRHRIAIVAPNIKTARDVCIEGESGLLSVLAPDEIENWNRSMGELTLTNGALFKLYSSETPENLRGPQHHRAWLEELAAWVYLQDTWDMLMMGLRLGENPQAVATTTPKPKKLLKDIVSRETTVVSTGSTFDNAANLAPAALAEFRKRYEGTRLGQQELYAVMLEDVEGALWSGDNIEFYRISQDELPELGRGTRIAVGVDPAVTSAGNEHGIVTAVRFRRCPLKRCLGSELPHAFVLEDSTCHGSPNEWGRRVLAAYRDWEADVIVPEVNNGGEMVTNTIRTLDSSANIFPVHASRGKKKRAEPISALYEQGRVHHVGMFTELENQMTTWDPDDEGDSDIDSPDRMDALVWALTNLMVEGRPVVNAGRAKDVRQHGRR